MDHLLTNPPLVTHAEIAVVVTAAFFLCVTPVLFAWADARRRRLEMRAAARAAAAMMPPPEPSTFTGLPEVPVTETLDRPLAVEDQPVASGLELGWPAVPAAAESEVAPEAPVAAVSSMSPPPLVEETVSLDSTEAAAIPAAAPPVAPALPEADHGPARRVAEFEPAPTETPQSQRCQLIDLRQARLPEWPPRTLLSDPEREQLWHTGERLAASFDRQISTTSIAAPPGMESAALGAVETDGQRFRLHFLLFDELWPSDVAQARAEAVFEIDPVAGVQRSWVVNR